MKRAQGNSAEKMTWQENMTNILYFCEEYCHFLSMYSWEEKYPSRYWF